jgi:hypothetical protein
MLPQNNGQKLAVFGHTPSEIAIQRREEIARRGAPERRSNAEWGAPRRWRPRRSFHLVALAADHQDTVTSSLANVDWIVGMFGPMEF